MDRTGMMEAQRVTQSPAGDEAGGDEAGGVAAARSAADTADGDGHALDPATSERRIYRARFPDLQREIWRPGDGDGDQTADYFNRKGEPLPLDERWRLFQSDIGEIDEYNQPPRFVILDDKAALEVLRSDIPKARMAQNWPHDFAGQGKVRSRRVHRGRAAIKDEDATDDNLKYHATAIGKKGEDYLFSGEKDYIPVVYHYVRPQKKTLKRHAPSGWYNPRGHGHNQHTPRDLLVKHGAPSFSVQPQPFRAPRINPFLRRDASPTRAQYRATKIDAENQSPGLDPPNTVTTTTPDDLDLETIKLPPNMTPAMRESLIHHMTRAAVDSVKGEGDVTRLASALSWSRVQVAEQVEEIQRLRKAIVSAEAEKKSEVGTSARRVAELEQRVDDLHRQLAVYWGVSGEKAKS